MSQPYELLCIFPGTLTDEEVTKSVSSIQDILSQYEATAVKAENMGKNRLSYPMKHIRYGYFYFFTFEMKKDTVGQVDKKLHILPNLLRYILRIHNPKSEPPRMFADVEKEEMKDTHPAKIVETPRETSEPTIPETPVAEETKPKKATKREDDKEVSMEEIDQKLDDILDKTISSI